MRTLLRHTAVITLFLLGCTTSYSASTGPAPVPPAPSGSSGAVAQPPAGGTSQQGEGGNTTGSTAPGGTATDGQCNADADCVPATGCHPAACVPRAQYVASAQPMMCTRECRGGTLDCGGHCGCEAGRCVAHFANP